MFMELSCIYALIKLHAGNITQHSISELTMLQFNFSLTGIQFIVTLFIACYISIVNIK